MKRSTRLGATKLRAFGVVGIAAVLTLSACGRGDSGGGGGAASDPGITDDSITLGASYPASGPASAYAGVNKGINAAFQAANAHGGVKMGDGKTRKLKYVLYDDAYTPEKAVSNARRLAENDQVFAFAGFFGTPGNNAIASYVDSQKVPNIDIYSTSEQWRNPKTDHPYVTSWGMTGQQEFSATTADILKQDPHAKVATILANDDQGAILIALMEKMLGDSGGELVSKQTYDITAPTVDSQVTNMANSGADFVQWLTGPKQIVQGIQKATQLGWKPQMYVPIAGSSIPAVMQPAGPGAVGMRSAVIVKNPVDPKWANDPALKTYRDVITKYGDGLSPDDQYANTGYAMGQSILAQLERLKDPTRAALIKLAKDYSQKYDVPTLLPGVKFNENSNDQKDTGIKIQQYDGTTWHLDE